MITTERLLLRPYQPEDSACFFNNINKDKEYLVDYFYNLISANGSQQQTKAYLLLKAENWEEHTSYSCGVFLKGSLTLIGHISVREIDWRVPKGEIAYFIFKAYTGQRYATEALMAFRNWCFTVHKFNRLFLKVAGDNIASIKVAGQCAFKAEGLLKKDYKKNAGQLVDMLLFGYTEDQAIIRTDSKNNDFVQLISLLDAELFYRNGEKQSFYNQFNKVDMIKHVVVAYVNGIAVGCGAIKSFETQIMEIKRMFVKDEHRGKGIAGSILTELENWAKELGNKQTVLETGKAQLEALGLYQKNGYIITENYGQYKGVENSICFKKEL